MIVKDADGKDVIVTQTGTKLANIGKMTIHTDGTISTELISEVVPSEVNRTYTVQKNDSLSRIAKRELGAMTAGERFMTAIGIRFLIRVPFIPEWFLPSARAVL